MSLLSEFSSFPFPDHRVRFRVENHASTWKTDWNVFCAAAVYNESHEPRQQLKLHNNDRWYDMMIDIQTANLHIRQQLYDWFIWSHVLMNLTPTFFLFYFCFWSRPPPTLSTMCQVVCSRLFRHFSGNRYPLLSWTAKQWAETHHKAL